MIKQSRLGSNLTFINKVQMQCLSITTGQKKVQHLFKCDSTKTKGAAVYV